MKEVEAWLSCSTMLIINSVERDRNKAMVTYAVQEEARHLHIDADRTRDLGASQAR